MARKHRRTKKRAPEKKPEEIARAEGEGMPPADEAESSAYQSQRVGGSR